MDHIPYDAKKKIEELRALDELTRKLYNENLMELADMQRRLVEVEAALQQCADRGYAPAMWFFQKREERDAHE